MAEYKEIRSIAIRMCAKVGNCDACPAHEACPWSMNSQVSDEVLQSVEEAILAWGARNPAPRYPSWKEWKETTFPESRDDDGFWAYPCSFGATTAAYCAEHSCKECREREIPAWAAKRMGIEPKEETSHDDD